MNRTFGATLLVAGTSIGSGMLALPMVLAPLGLIPSIFLMFCLWAVIYYTALVSLELNLQAGQGLSLGALANHFSGRGAAIIGTVSLKLLMYSLLAAYIFGGSSILQEFLLIKLNNYYALHKVATAYTLVTFVLLLFPLKKIDFFNRLLFIGLLVIVALLIGGLCYTIDIQDLPLFSHQVSTVYSWAFATPVVFCCFGFQIIFHTLTRYCRGEARTLKRVFFWGSLVPMLVYITWTFSTLGVLYHHNLLTYQQMVIEHIPIDLFIQTLSTITRWPAMQLFIWSIATLAIATSVIGVSISLHDSTKEWLTHTKIPQSSASLFVLIPPYLVAVLVPNAFVTFLGFAGMILSIIAILLPIYLLSCISSRDFFYPELRYKILLISSFGVGMIIIFCQLYHLVHIF